MLEDTQDIPYSPREIREKWNDIANSLSLISVNVSTGFIEMKAKQDTTNGRVKDLEISRARNDGFNRAFAISGAAAWTIAMAVTGWVLIQIIMLETTLDFKIQTAVNTALSVYNINGK